MKNYFINYVLLSLILLLAEAGSNGCLLAQNGWEELNYSGSRKSCVGTCMVGEEIYLIGGYVETGLHLAGVEAYNIVSGELSSKQNLHASLAFPEAETIGGKIYVTGGFINDVAATNALQVYDPDTDSWTLKKQMPAYIGHHISGVIDGQLYVAGGIHKEADPTNFKTSLTFVYDPANDEWDTLAHMNSTLTVDARVSGRCRASSCVYDGKLYVFGGFRFMANEEHSYLPTPEMYDPETDTWTELPDMPLPLAHHASIVYKDKIYIFGGTTASQYTTIYEKSNRVFEFDPVLETWQEMVGMPYNLATIEGHRVDNMLYLAGDDIVYLCRFNLDFLEILTSVENHEKAANDLFILHPNYPNPFSGQTTIRYDLSMGGAVELTIYDILGHKITTLVNGFLAPGQYNTYWLSEGTEPGIYFCELAICGVRQMIKMVKR